MRRHAFPDITRPTWHRRGNAPEIKGLRWTSCGFWRYTWRLRSPREGLESPVPPPLSEAATPGAYVNVKGSGTCLD